MGKIYMLPALNKHKPGLLMVFTPFFQRKKGWTVDDA